MTRTSDSDDVYRATVNELVGNFRSALLALVPLAKRAAMPFADEEMSIDWEKLQWACFDAFVANPIRVDREGKGQLPLAPYDDDLEDYPGVSWLTTDATDPYRAAVIRLLSKGEPFDAVEVVRIDPESLRAGERAEVPFDYVHFDYYRRMEDGSAYLISRIEAVE